MLTNLEVETLIAVKRAANKLTNQDVDWEQRRYELAKDFMAHLIPKAIDRGNPHGLTGEEMVDTAVQYADKLIEKLRKKL